MQREAGSKAGQSPHPWKTGHLQARHASRETTGAKEEAQRGQAQSAKSRRDRDQAGRPSRARAKPKNHHRNTGESRKGGGRERREPPNGRPREAGSSMAVGSDQAKDTRVLNPGRSQKGKNGRHTPGHGQQRAKAQNRNGGKEHSSRAHAQKEGTPRRRKGSTEPERVLGPKARKEPTEGNKAAHKKLPDLSGGSKGGGLNIQGRGSGLLAEKSCDPPCGSGPRLINPKSLNPKSLNPKP